MWRNLAHLAGVAAIALAVAAGAATAEPVALRTGKLDLVPENPTALRIGDLEFQGGISIRSADKRFGGLSGLRVMDGGGRLVAVSDEGLWFTARLVYDAAGNLAGVEDGALGPLVGTDGKPLADKLWRDAEALTEWGDGMVIGFEHVDRLWFYPGAGRDPAAPFALVPIPLTTPPGIENVPQNGGMEAISRLRDGRFLAIAETYAAGPDLLHGWVGTSEGRSPTRLRWSPVVYRKRDGFAPTDAAMWPDGGVLVVERRVLPPFRLSSRLRLIPADQIYPGRVLDGEVLVTLDQRHSIDNFEGVSVVRNRDGETFIYLVSDDNYMPFQRTLLFMFAYRPPISAAGPPER